MFRRKADPQNCLAQGHRGIAGRENQNSLFPQSRGQTLATVFVADFQAQNVRAAACAQPGFGELLSGHVSQTVQMLTLLSALANPLQHGQDHISVPGR